jgi:alpha-amylase
MFKFIFLCACLVSVFAANTAQWQKRTIYQIITDRFSSPSGKPCPDIHNYCGGNFQGIIDHLDYIQGMGFDAIWISPVVENVPGAYHGYAASDIFKINGFFGGEQGLRALVQAVHRRGMYIMVDVVANHMATGDYSSFKPFNQTHHYHDCNGCPDGCWIQNFQNMWEVEHCRLCGLNDLNQDVPFVRSTLKNWIHKLVHDFEIDGLRIDTIPEVKAKFWNEFYEAAGKSFALLL